MDLGADHTEGLGARVDVVKSWLDGADVAAELLVDAVVGLGDCFVGVLHEAAAKTGHPGAHAAAALPPTLETLAIAGQFCVVGISFGEADVFGLAGEPLLFILVHLSSQFYL